MLATEGRNARGGKQSDGMGSAAERYQVLRREDEGTFFIAYRVRERATKRVLALKALKTNFARHANFVAALAEVGERNLDLSHPHLAETVEIGEEENTLFLTEEWLNGPSLESHLRRAPLRPEETLALMRQIADALRYLHGRNIVHGDLRPRQILFADDHTIKLTDIGFSEAFAQTGVSLIDVQNEAARYWSPQRFEGQAPEVADDLYAVGVILYRMLAGRVPFDGSSSMGIATRHRADTPLRPTQYNPFCPRELEAIAFRLLEKNPQNRYSSATQLIEALDEARAAITPGAAALNGATEFEEDESTLEEDEEAARQEESARRLRDKARQGAATDANLADIVDEKTARRRHGKREMIGAFLAIFWSLVSIGLLVGVLYGAYYFWVDSLPKEVTVPKYVGMNQYDAERALKAKGLELKVVREPYDSKRKSGTVLWGSKSSGQKVRTGTVIDIAVSKGEQPIKMYDFTELSIDQARAIAERHGMRLGQIAERYDDKVPKGYIVGQYPEPGQPLRRTDPISLVISRGAQPSADTIDGGSLPPRPPNSLESEEEEAPSIDGRNTQPDSTLVSRAVAVRVVLPVDGGAQRVRVEIEDADGRDTVYDERHQPGDLVDEVVQVIREQGTTATVRIYVGDKLTKTMRI